MQRITEFLSGLDPSEEVLLLAPSRGAADDALWTACPNGAAGVHRFSLNQFAAVTAAPALALRGLSPANGLASEALVARVLHDLRTRDALRYFAPVAGSPGFPRALARTLNELRLDEVPVERLRASGKVPGLDLALCFDSYAHQLQSNSLADLAQMYQLALETLRSGPSHFSGMPVIVLDLDPRHHLQRRFLDHVVNTSRRVLRWQPAHTPTGSRAIDRVRRYVFAPQIPERAGFDESVDFFSAAGEALECVEIARRILGAAGSGVPFDRMAVLLRAPEAYGPLLEEAFRRASIPAYFSRGAVRPDPAGRAFLALLSCAIENCSASRFAEYLSLGQVPSAQPRPGETPPGQTPPDSVAPDDEIYSALSPGPLPPEPAPVAAEPPVDENSPVLAGSLQSPVNWEKLLIDAAVIGGPDRWERQLDGWENELRLRWSRSHDQPGEQARLTAEIERLGNLRDFALPVIRHLSELPKAASWGDWLQSLELLARVALRRPSSVRAVLAELQPMSDIGPVGLPEVYSALSERLRFLRREPPRRRYGHVFVCAIEEAQARTFEIVFLPGLAEGQFPRKVAEDPLLLDEHRERIDPGLDLNRNRRERERMLLKIALDSAQKLVFSYPRIQLAESRARVPSFYALEIIRAALGYLPELRQFQAAAADRAPTRLDRPAPRDFAEAIDSTEYDLVALERALHADRAESTGAMRYLVSANENLARSLRLRYSRWEDRKWTAADGLYGSGPATRAAIAPHRLAERAYSPTALQHFASCPYRFLLHSIYGLRRREAPEPLYQMDALTRGALFHEVQRDVYRELSRSGLLPLTADTFREAQTLTDRILDDTDIRYARKLAPAIGRVWRSEIEDIRSDLHGWLKHVLASPDWLPVHTEFSFGLRADQDCDPASTPEPVILQSGAKLRGRIDLVERHSARDVFRVVDHKTGKAPEQRQIRLGGGTALQPALYALALEQILGGTVESGRLFFCTQRGNYEAREVALTPQTRAFVARALEIIDDALAAGQLPAAPARDACTFCDYRPVCGPYEEMRRRRKPALDSLDELRSMQ